MKKSPRTRSQQPNRTVSIIGTGSYVPERVVTNGDLEKLVETSDEWITSRTGIKERRIAAEDEHTSHMASKAAAPSYTFGRYSSIGKAPTVPSAEASAANTLRVSA